MSQTGVHQGIIATEYVHKETHLPVVRVGALQAGKEQCHLGLNLTWFVDKGQNGWGLCRIFEFPRWHPGPGQSLKKSL